MFRITDGIRVKNLNLPSVTKLGTRSLVSLIRSGERVIMGFLTEIRTTNMSWNFYSMRIFLSTVQVWFLKVCQPWDATPFKAAFSREWYSWCACAAVPDAVEYVSLVNYTQTQGERQISFHFTLTPAALDVGFRFLFWPSFVFPPIVSHFSFSLPIILIFCHVAVGSTCFSWVFNQSFFPFCFIHWVISSHLENVNASLTFIPLTFLRQFFTNLMRHCVRAVTNLHCGSWRLYMSGFAEGARVFSLWFEQWRSAYGNTVNGLPLFSLWTSFCSKQRLHLTSKSTGC